MMALEERSLSVLCTAVVGVRNDSDGTETRGSCFVLTEGEITRRFTICLSARFPFNYSCY